MDSSAGMLQDISSRFGDHILAEVSKIAAASANVVAGTNELSSLGEAFSLSVDRFNSSNAAMIKHLTRLEESIAESSTRSDEQPAYAYLGRLVSCLDTLFWLEKAGQNGKS